MTGQPRGTSGVRGPRVVWEWWKRAARKIGDFQARLILALFYFVILTPFALGIRLGGDPLAIKRRTPKGWRLRPDEGDPVERAKRQF